MNEREALKLAKQKIEAAMECHPNAVPHLLGEALDFINEALAQPEQKYTTTRNAWTGKATYKCNICGRDDFRSEHAAAFHECGEKAQPEQEPVAWMASDDSSAIENSPPHPELIHQWIPLYTTPPQRKPWVGLTDEERNVINRQNIYVSDIISATEAKLKEKNT